MIAAISLPHNEVIFNLDDLTDGTFDANNNFPINFANLGEEDTGNIQPVDGESSDPNSS